MATVFTLPPAGSTLSSREDGAPAPAAPGLFARILQALMAARQRQADREIAEILSRRGGAMAEEGVFGPSRRPYPGGLPG